MKKQIIIFSLIGLVVIIGAGAYYFVKKPVIKVNDNASSQAQDQKTAVQPLNVKNISDIIQEAASGGDLIKCNEVAEPSLAADCSAQASFSLAIQKKDKKYCENIVNKSDQNNCLKVLTGMGIK